MRNRFCISRLFACVALLCLAAGVVRAQEAGDIRAHERAQAWVKLLDEGRYATSWEQTAALFRDNIMREEWVAMLKNNRSLLGKVTARKLQKLTRSHTLPDAPEGNYVVIVFETIFAGRGQAASEFVILAMTDNRGNLLPPIESTDSPAGQQEIIPPLEGAQWSPFSYYVSFEAQPAASVEPVQPPAAAATTLEDVALPVEQTRPVEPARRTQAAAPVAPAQPVPQVEFVLPPATPAQ